MSNETSGQKKINLTENCEAVKTFLEIAEILNGFFFNIIQNLDFYKIFKQLFRYY